MLSWWARFQTRFESVLSGLFPFLGGLARTGGRCFSRALHPGVLLPVRFLVLCYRGGAAWVRGPGCHGSEGCVPQGRALCLRAQRAVALVTGFGRWGMESEPPARLLSWPVRKRSPTRTQATELKLPEACVGDDQLDTNRMSKRQLGSFHFENALISVDNTVLQNVKVLYKFLIQKE